MLGACEGGIEFDGQQGVTGPSGEVCVRDGYHRFLGVQVDGEGVGALARQDQGYPGDVNAKKLALTTRSPRVVLLVQEVCGEL